MGRILTFFIFISAFSLFAQSIETPVIPEVNVSIDSLGEGEWFVLEYASSGCFHFVRDSIKIKKENGLYFLAYQDGAFKLLNDSELSIIREFEYELQKERANGCTTVEEYWVRTPDERIKVCTDGSCHWGGWFELKERLQLSGG